MTEYSRLDLIRLCEAAVVDHDHWRNRDSLSAQKNIGEAWVLLRAGVPYRIMDESDELQSDARSIWVEFKARGFGWFEGAILAEDDGSDDDLTTILCYIPTQARLDAVKQYGRVGGLLQDWY